MRHGIALSCLCLCLVGRRSQAGSTASSCTLDRDHEKDLGLWHEVTLRGLEDSRQTWSDEMWVLRRPGAVLVLSRFECLCEGRVPMTWDTCLGSLSWNARRPATRRDGAARRRCTCIRFRRPSWRTPAVCSGATGRPISRRRITFGSRIRRPAKRSRRSGTGIDGRRARKWPTAASTSSSGTRTGAGPGTARSTWTSTSSGPWCTAGSSEPRASVDGVRPAARRRPPGV